MIIQEIYGSILCIINDFEEDISSWIKMKRLNKPRGIINYMVNYLKEFDEDTIILKLQQFSENIKNIHTIIYSDNSDSIKLIKLIKIMDVTLNTLNTLNTDQNNDPIDCEFYETKMNNWLGI